MRPHRATLLRSSSFGLRIRKPGLPMPAAEWFEFSSFSPSAGIRSQIQEIRRKAKLALIKEVASLAAKGRGDLGQVGDEAINRRRYRGNRAARWRVPNAAINALVATESRSVSTSQIVEWSHTRQWGEHMSV